LTIDFGNVSNDYAKYRDRLPAVLFEQLIERGIDFKGQNVVDLGSGSGIFSRDLTIPFLLRLELGIGLIVCLLFRILRNL
jgi:hypothetical protein